MNDAANVVQPLVENPVSGDVKTPENTVSSIPTSSSEQLPSSTSVPSDDSDQPVSTSTPQIDSSTNVSPNVVDLRANGVDDDVQVKTDHKVTEEADKEEEEFIDHVEEVHSIAS